MRDLVRVSTVFKKNNNLGIQTYLAQTFVKQVLYRHEHAEAEMMRIDAVDFSQKFWIGKHQIVKYDKCVLILF